MGLYVVDSNAILTMDKHTFGTCSLTHSISCLPFFHSIVVIISFNGPSMQNYHIDQGIVSGFNQSAKSAFPGMTTIEN